MRWRALAFLSPWLLGVAIFLIYPLVATIWFSFTYYDQFNPPVWVGLRNWVYVFTEYPPFWQALGNTLWFVVIMVALRVVFGLGLGLLVTKVKRGASILRTVFYLPYLAPPVVATIGFVFLLNPATGPVDQILGSLGLPEPNWFGDPSLAKPSLTLLAIWGVGDLMLIFMAALLDVPTSLYEAAELDGAGAWQRFRFITLPTIRPVILFAVITGVIATAQYYTQALIAGAMASGILPGSGSSFEPGYPDGSTLTVPQLVYSLGFQHFNTGAACVMALVLFAVSMGLTGFLLRPKAGLVDAGRTS
ncbi:carbohydrate ABC transporter permease [Planotetraspora sp. GP83]|uniref:carbohydrate ABC transporter permease n=1 Tax=Planotetraspora sp. GP83 TaxID=3156264 RepID=UPI003518305F